MWSGDTCTCISIKWYTNMKFKECKCPRGFVLGDDSTCSPCGEDEYSLESNRGTCTKCDPFGRLFVGATEDRFTCECIPGFYYDLDTDYNFAEFKNFECRPCSEGFFKSEVGTFECTRCPEGTFSSSPGSTQCTQCADGTVSIPLKDTCISCMAGYKSNTERNSCTKCEDNEWSRAESAECLECNGELRGSGDGCVCQADYVLTNPDSTVRCENEMNCGQYLDCTECPDGKSTFGVLNQKVCTDCERGSLLHGNECRQCTTRDCSNVGERRPI